VHSTNQVGTARVERHLIVRPQDDADKEAAVTELENPPGVAA
jgi:hypothetical protein